MLCILAMVKTSLIQNNIFKSLVPEDLEDIELKFNTCFSLDEQSYISNETNKKLQYKIYAHYAILKRSIDITKVFAKADLNKTKGIVFKTLKADDNVDQSDTDMRIPQMHRDKPIYLTELNYTDRLKDEPDSFTSPQIPLKRYEAAKGLPSQMLPTSKCLHEHEKLQVYCKVLGAEHNCGGIGGFAAVQNDDVTEKHDTYGCTCDRKYHEGSQYNEHDQFQPVIKLENPTLSDTSYTGIYKAACDSRDEKNTDELQNAHSCKLITDIQSSRVSNAANDIAQTNYSDTHCAVSFIKAICSIFYSDTKDNNFIYLPLCGFIETFLVHYKPIAEKAEHFKQMHIDLKTAIVNNSNILYKERDKRKWKNAIQEDIAVFVYNFLRLSCKDKSEDGFLEKDKIQHINFEAYKAMDSEINQKPIADNARRLEVIKIFEEVDKLVQKNKEMRKEWLHKYKKRKVKKIRQKIKTCDENRRHVNLKNTYKLKNNKMICYTKACRKKWTKKRKHQQKIGRKEIIDLCCYCLSIKYTQKGNFLYFVADTCTCFYLYKKSDARSNYQILQLTKVADVNSYTYGSFAKHIDKKGEIIYAFTNAAVIEITNVIKQPYLPGVYFQNFKMLYFTFLASKIIYSQKNFLDDQIFYDLYFPFYYMIFAKVTYKPENMKRYRQSVLAKQIKILKSKYHRLINVLLNEQSYRIRTIKYDNIKKFFAENRIRHELIQIWHDKIFIHKTSLCDDFEKFYGTTNYSQYHYRRISMTEDCNIQ